MGFFGIGTPKWRHADPVVRRKALERLTSADEHIFVRMALTDADEGLRASAAHKVASETNLQRLATEGDAKIVAIVRSRLAGVAQRLVREGRLAEVRGLLGGIKEHSALAELACTATDPAVRVGALDHLLGLAEPSPTALATVAIQDAEGSLAERALGRISRRGILKDIARKAKSTRIRALAETRLQAEDANEKQPSPERRRVARRAALEALLPRFSRVVVATDLSVARNEFDLVSAAFEEILASADDLDEDEICSQTRNRQRQAEAALTVLRNQQHEREQAVVDAVSVREAFLDRVDDGTEAGARADLELAWDAMTAVPNEFGTRLDQRFAETIAARFRVTMGTGYRVLDAGESSELAAVAAEAEKLVGAADTRESKPSEFRFQDLHKRWSALTHGCDPQLVDRVRFTRAWDDFKARRRTARDARRAESDLRMDQLHALVRKAEEFAAAPVTEVAQQARSDDLKRLRSDWRAVGNVRGGEGLRGQFDRAIDAAFEPLKALREAEDWERFANVAKAEQLAVEVSALAEVQDLPTVARTVKDAHRRWKLIGPLPHDRERDLWQSFKAACDTQFDRCKIHFAEQDARRALAKTEKDRILAEAERLVGSARIGLAGSPAERAGKEAAAEGLKGLQAAWKSAGAAPREDDERLWQAFRSVCDGFFQGLNAVRDQEFQANLHRKEAVLVELEKLAGAVRATPTPSPNERERWLRQVKDLQGRWRDIGFVPRDNADGLQRRLRAACDTVYEASRSGEPDEDANEQVENLAAKLDFCARLEALAQQSDAREDAEQLRLRWAATGAVPTSERHAVEARWKAAWAAVASAAPR